MARLPVSGGDAGVWGDVLNDYLAVAHNTDGTLKDGAVSTNTIQDNSVSGVKLQNSTVTAAKLNVSSGTDGQVLSRNSAAAGGFSWVSGIGGDPAVGGDLSGVASNAQIVANAVGSTELATDAVTTAKITDANVTEPKLAIANTPSTSQALSWNGTAMEWAAPTTGSGGPGSSGTILVASNDAPAIVKAYADYVCDGTNDEVQINLAIDDASPLNSRNSLMPAGAKQTGTVQLTGGRFNISAPITMRTAVWLRGMGYGTELRAVSNSGTAVIALATPKDHLCHVSDMYIYGNGASGGTCNGIDFDMRDASPSTAGYPDTNADSYHLIHDLYIDQFTTGTRHAIHLQGNSTAPSTNNRGNIVDRIQVRDCSGNGVYFDSASDSFIANSHVGGCGDSAFRAAGGNTKISNCKSFYSSVAGFNLTSGRATISGCEMQDDVVGMILASSNASVSGVIVDTCQNDGIVVSTSNVSLTGFSIYLRSGGLYATQANGLRFSGSLSNVECVGRVNPASITTPISGTPTAPSFMRVVDGTTVVSVG